MSAAEKAAMPTVPFDTWMTEVTQGLRSRKLAPYLGPGVSALVKHAAVPTSYAALAQYFAAKVALPKRARGNPWASAQYVESRQHRSTVTSMMRSAFAEAVPPTPFLTALARAKLPLIVDTWYDGALRTALTAEANWAEVQGITRAGIGESRWFIAYDEKGDAIPMADASSRATLVYKPHGGVTPVGNFLITDADYVEVLTEIDIQSPIPPEVQTRRRNLGFVFLGCRFDDQLLRTYARQIVKRSAGPNFAVFESPNLTRMEQSFVAELEMRVAIAPLAQVVEHLVAL